MCLFVIISLKIYYFYRNKNELVSLSSIDLVDNESIDTNPNMTIESQSSIQQQQEDNLNNNKKVSLIKIIVYLFNLFF